MRPPLRRSRRVGLTLAAAGVQFLLCFTAPSAAFAAPAIPNPSFELDAAPPNFPGYINGNKAITGWVTNDSTRTGLNPGLGGFSPFADNGTIPNGARVAFIQSTGGSSTTLTTTITGLTVGTWYRVQFRANCRTNPSDPIAAYRIDNGPDIAFTASPAGSGPLGGYHTISAIFKATAATAPLEISNSSPADSTLLVDDFSITAATAIVVTKTADDGSAGTLRKALVDAAASTTVFNVITFAPALNGATITLNNAELVVDDGSGVAVEASTLSNGITIDGGAGANRIFSVSSASVAALRRLTLTNGNGSGALSNDNGGAIYNAGTLILAHCTLSENTGTFGGAVRNDGRLVASACTFNGNACTQYGGAIFNNEAVSLDRCTLTDNQATLGGGALADNGGDETFVISHCTISGNRSLAAGSGGGGDCFGATSISMSYTLLSGNTANGVLRNYGSTSSLPPLSANAHNLADDAPSGFTGTDVTNSAAINLAALASNGGPTQTMAFAANSPARNAAVGSTITTDQRGLPVVDAPDIGAFEMQGTSSFTLGATTPAFEGGVAEIVINRGTNISGISTVRLFTTAGSAGAADFTARPNTAASNVTFLDGETTKTVAIRLTADNLAEGNETFTVTLGSPTPAGATVPGGAAASATVTIMNAYMVSKLADSGGGSLRQALADAASNLGPDAISFAPALAAAGTTITLSTEIVVSDADGVTVDASSIGGIKISGNNATRLFSVDSTGNLTLRRLTLNGGNGSGATSPGFGGAVFVKAGGRLTLRECTVSGNSATLYGGGFYNRRGALTLTQCTISGNSAAYGGGIYSDTVTGDFTFATLLSRCTLSGNEATSSGGALLNYNGITSLVHCTVTDNTAPADQGGGVASYGDPGTQTIVDKCIIAANSASDVDFVDSTTHNSFTSAGRNVIGSGNATGDFGLPGDVISVADPGLASLFDKGGPTQTHALLPGSPALDRAEGSTITSDQRGFSLYGAADTGAFEAQQGAYFIMGLIANNVLEGQTAQYEISRINAFRGPARVRFSTTTGTAGIADFTGRPNTTVSDLDFADGEVSKSVSIPTLSDTLIEANETYTWTLGSPVAPATVGSGTTQSGTTFIKDTTLLVTTLNDDGPGSLREAFSKAASSPGLSYITFTPALSGKTVILGGEIGVNDGGGVIVDASNLPKGLTINAGVGDYRIFAVGNSAATPLTLRCLTLTGGGGSGAGPDGYGGGIYVAAGTLVMDRCTLTGNTAGTRGGAVFLDGLSTLQLSRCTLANNSATNDGGAIFGAPSSNMQLRHCTFSGNTAQTGSGGAVYNLSSSAMTLERSILFGNNAPASALSADIFNSNALDLVGTSLVGAVSSGTTGGAGSLSFVDPLLEPLGDYGGPTMTFALQPGSPAVDGGAGSAFTTDQRGFPVVADADIGAFEEQLGGTFVMEAAGYSVSEGGIVTVTIKRLGGTQGSASVRLYTANGTAKAPDDYAARLNTAPAAEVVFAEGQREFDVDIGTQADSLPEANESFTAVLGAPSPGCVIGTPSFSTVTIIDPSSLPGAPVLDTIKPAVTLTSPAASAAVGVDLGQDLVITGTATDNKGVASVQANINGSVASSTTLNKPGAPSTDFAIRIPSVLLRSGINTLTVSATDGNNNTITSALRSFKILRPLLISMLGSGTVTTGYAPKSYREVGAPQTLTATAGADFLFFGWSITSGHTPAQLGLPTDYFNRTSLTFIHREGLGLQAFFAANPFTLANTGTFNGSILPSALQPPTGGSAPGGVGTVSRLDTEGYVSITLQKTGAFSGTLRIDGMTLPVAGSFDSFGSAHFGTSRATSVTVPRAGKPSLVVALNYFSGSNTITGQVIQVEGTNTTAVSDIAARRAAFSSTNPVLSTSFGATTRSPIGSYTSAFSPPSPGSLSADQAPNGFGYATVTISSSGMVSVTGTLQDGTAVTCSTTLAANGTWTLFSQLYPGLQGFLSGALTLDLSQISNDFQSGTIRWICPLQDRQHYPLGWPEGLNTSMVGSRYVATSGSSIIPLNQLVGTGDGNATLGFSDGLLGSPLSFPVDITPTDGVTEVPASSSYSMTISRTTGMISGSFNHTSQTLVTTSTPYSGMVFQKSGSALKALGFFRTATPAVKDYTGQSGAVSLNAQ